MPGMKLNSVCLDIPTASSPSFACASTWPSSAEECSIPSPATSCSEVAAKKRNTRKLELRQDLLKNYTMPTFGNPSTTEMFGQMTPAHEEEMHLGGSTPAQPQQQSIPAIETAVVATPEDSDDEFELSWEEFEKRYVPLSHLPTPPWSDSSSVEGRNMAADDDDMLDPQFYAPAKYLATMAPRNASREAPSVRRLQGYLQRANLKMEVMALAGSVLDCLSGRFVRQWRAECSSALELETDSPEAGSILILMAALCVAMKFLEDSSYTTRFWTVCVCDDLFSPAVLAKTERLVLADLGYCLHGISAPDMLQYSIDEIKRYAELPGASASLSSDDSEAAVPSSPSAKVERAPSPFPMLS